MNPDPIDYRTPVDILEPESRGDNSYREASLCYFQIISLAVSYILSADDQLTAAYGVAFALGLTSIVENRTQREIARELGISHGTISAHCQRFSRMCGLPPSILMKSEEASQGCRAARNTFCQQ